MENDTAVQSAHTEIAQQVHIELRKKSFTQKGAIIMLIRTNTIKSKYQDEEVYYHPFVYVLSISLYFDSKEPDFIVIFKCS